MLKKTLAVMTLLAVACIQAPAQQPRSAGQSVLVRKDTALQFTLLCALDSATAQVGDPVPLRLSRPLIVDGVTLIPEGQVVNGKVTSVRRAIPNSQDGDLKWKLDRISFMDSTSAKTRIWFTYDDPERFVPDKYEQGYPGYERFGATGVFYVVLFVATLPVSLPVMLLERAGMPHFYEDFHLPANSTVAVIIVKNHRVRY